MTFVPQVAHSLTSHGGNDKHDPTLQTYTAFHMTQDPISGDVSPAVGVRRLTPRECERLQALPDDWTNHGPDSRRYAALGDAVTSSVAEWIGRRILGGAA